MAQIDYPAHLEAMWQKAIAPRQPNAPTVISTFAGGGGSLTGYMMAGFNDLLAVEWDDNAVQTLRLNWPKLDIYHGDIARLSVEEVLRRTGLQPGELDILDGSPPCQGFSTAGKRIMDDPRNQLFTEYVRLLRGLRPKVFVMENVSGMVKGKMKLVFVDILKELKASGYLVSAKLLNAKYFHVPQSRERMIFIGVRDDLGIAPSHPKAESGEISVKMAIGAKGSYTNSSFEWKRQTGKPFQTFTKTKSKSHIIFDANGERDLTQKELQIATSFPVLYSFTSLEKAIERIGNSVPPLFMEAIARHIRAVILQRMADAFPGIDIYRIED